MKRRVKRRGIASLEAVMATAITVPMFVLLLKLGLILLRWLYHVVATLVGWPCL